jgi:hypothetical protein
MIRMEIKEIIKISITTIIIMMCGFEIGYLSHSLININIVISEGNYSFEIGEMLNSTLNRAIDKTNVYIFSCSTMWYDFGLKCNGTKFVNVTGMYCDNILVCENKKVDD